MRIIGGKFKGTKLFAPAGRETRPTSDRVREAVFNVLAHGALLPDGLAGVRVLDVFAGTGAMGLEALSRGANYCSFVDDSVAARAAIRKNIEATGTFGTTKILRYRAENIGRRPKRVAPFDLVFMDPPYGEDVGAKVISTLIADEWLTSTAAIVLETASRREFNSPEGVHMDDQRTYGDTEVRFMVRGEI